MLKELGRVCELVRYPIKSMAGASADSATLGWHGLDGDRRFAFRRLGDESGFPWLSASRVPELLLYHPLGCDESSGEPLPTHVRTPSGRELELRSAELRDEIAARLGSSVELMKMKHGIFDDAPVSVISTTTVDGIAAEAGVKLDRRRFRANIVLETLEHQPFLEDEWLTATLLFGDGDSAPAVRVTMRDLRCVMINLDPDTATHDPRVMKTVVRLNDNNAGVYGTVVQTGTIRVGDRVRLATTASSSSRSA
ncbi:MAG TPA: MOSC domain-containing protein [Thermoanaerobaculia bacterium]|nr:MOSC domain-containing protein [Thermoanaerobaculia bacterium]